MQLIYIDESGINYKVENGLFKDSPYVFYGGLCVDDRKYFHLERLFSDIIREFFSIDDWRKQEIHATDIWAKTGMFNSFDKIKAKEFFAEVVQMIAKLNLATLIGFCEKSISEDQNIQLKEISYSVYAFLHNVEHYLSGVNDTGIIISDMPSSNNSRDIPLMSKLFRERMEWRFGCNSEKTIKSKYQYESRSCFVLDNIHYVDSKKSLFNQITDILLFLVMRAFYYEYLKINHPQIADIEKVPLDMFNFNYFTCNNVCFTNFNTEIEDVVFTENDFLKITRNSHDYVIRALIKNNNP